MKQLRISICLILFISLLVNSCKKAENSNGSTASTEAMFWVDTDFGCGSITVVCNGITKTITGYNTAQPSCGDSRAATFSLGAGTYSFTAHCSSKNWSGNVTVIQGQCNAFKLTSTGGTSGGNNGATGTAPTVTAPNTQFLAQQDYSVSANGAYSTQQFTLSASTKLVFRFTSQYQAQAAIIKSDQLSNFQGNKSFTGLGLFDKQIGTNTLTLSAGTYYLAIRNATSGANKWSVELDYAIELPASDKATYADTYLNGTKNFTVGSRFWQPFTVQSGYRYFLDGCNVNCDVRIIAASQLAAFQNGQTYQYYSEYYQAGGAAPGLSELTLPAGDYYIVSYNSTLTGSLVYTMERWKVTN